MNITATAISLNVDEPGASATFLTTHLGFRVEMEADGFVSLASPVEGGPNVIFLRTGLETFKPVDRAGSAGEGLLLVFIVDDIDAAFTAMKNAGAPVVTEPETEPWGERYCQFADPNGIVVQLVQWVS
ncbi:hypothetical protein GOARA_064_00260 [Gordonia araii NBRC 100433]|uniref:VOC domain-containing protein n=1 Tax=Gordonia araii NBRC 100433 TaxID=1073574 RepID=G7H599_9ACTN|nr:VOC family protein [Gordonia araii]NNG95739.1 glyoxalase [Gordonia araii NBRC 100433]GAB11024.1 hypothetical protein GOARA_064_00260 [Gordonia araii NBRC 100433]